MKTGTIFVVFLVMINSSFECDGHKIHKRMMTNTEQIEIQGTTYKNETPETLTSEDQNHLDRTMSSTDAGVGPIQFNSTPSPKIESEKEATQDSEKINVSDPILPSDTKLNKTNLLNSTKKSDPMNESKNQSLAVAMEQTLNNVEISSETPNQKQRTTTPALTTEAINRTQIPSNRNNSSNAFEIIKDCTCFSIRKPNLKAKAKQFENAFTSLLSKVESEMEALLENSVTKESNNTVGEHLVDTTPNSTALKVAETNKIEARITEVKDDVPFSEELFPFFPLESFIGRMMPVETIVIETDSDGVNPSKLLPKPFDSTKNGSQPVHDNNKMSAPKPEAITTPLL